MTACKTVRGVTSWPLNAKVSMLIRSAPFDPRRGADSKLWKIGRRRP
jgi:hypothetical protein